MARAAALAELCREKCSLEYGTDSSYSHIAFRRIIPFILRRLAWCGGLAKVLSVCTSVTRLESGGCGIRHDGAKSIAKVGAKCRALTHLDLRSNLICTKGAKSLAKVLGGCKALVHLNLSWKLMKAAGSRSLSQVLGECGALTSLNLRANELCVVFYR